MCVKISVKVATSSVKYGGFPLKILLILLKMKINHDHFLKLQIFKYLNLVFWLFILTGHILVETVPTSLKRLMPKARGNGNPKNGGSKPLNFIKFLNWVETNFQPETQAA